MEKNKFMMISIIILLVALLGAIVVVAFSVLNAMKNTDAGVGVAATDTPRVVELTREQITPVNFSDPISTNLLATADGESRVIRVKIGVGVNNVDKKVSDAFLVTLNANEVKVRDVIIDILHNKTGPELLKPDGMAALKAEILESLQEVFKNNLIVEVNMSDMYIN